MQEQHDNLDFESADMRMPEETVDSQESTSDKTTIVLVLLILLVVLVASGLLWWYVQMRAVKEVSPAAGDVPVAEEVATDEAMSDGGSADATDRIEEEPVTTLEELDADMAMPEEAVMDTGVDVEPVQGEEYYEPVDPVVEEGYVPPAEVESGDPETRNAELEALDSSLEGMDASDFE